MTQFSSKDKPQILYIGDQESFCVFWNPHYMELVP